MTVQEMKKLVCEAIDKNADNIIDVAESIFAEPELGYKEFKTAEKVKAVFDKLGFAYKDGIAITVLSLLLPEDSITPRSPLWVSWMPLSVPSIAAPIPKRALLIPADIMLR